MGVAGCSARKRTGVSLVMSQGGHEGSRGNAWADGGDGVREEEGGNGPSLAESEVIEVICMRRGT